MAAATDVASATAVSMAGAICVPPSTQQEDPEYARHACSTAPGHQLLHSCLDLSCVPTAAAPNSARACAMKDFPTQGETLTFSLRRVVVTFDTPSAGRA